LIESGVVFQEVKEKQKSLMRNWIW